MAQRWYCVQHGSSTAIDCGSTQKQKAFQIARTMAKEFPEEEIRVVFCTLEGEPSGHMIIVRKGTR